jgi:ABC-type polysaccharide/polyol phosphate export permease
MIKDLTGSLEHWRLWLLSSVYTVVLQYRRTFLGAVWISLGLLFLISVKGFVFTGVLGLSSERLIPNLAYGLAIWRLYTGLINGGCKAISSQRGLLLQRSLPLFVPSLSNISKNTFLFGFNISVAVLISLFFALPYWYGLPLAILGLLINFAAALPIGFVLSVACLRFRDLENTILSIMAVTFFVTPIIWLPEMAKGSRQFVLDFNPFYHMMEIIRDPMIGQPIELKNWIVAISLVAVAWALAWFVHRQNARQVLTWL